MPGEPTPGCWSWRGNSAVWTPSRIRNPSRSKMRWRKPGRCCNRLFDGRICVPGVSYLDGHTATSPQFRDHGPYGLGRMTS